MMMIRGVIEFGPQRSLSAEGFVIPFGYISAFSSVFVPDDPLPDGWASLYGSAVRLKSWTNPAVPPLLVQVERRDDLIRMLNEALTDLSGGEGEGETDDAALKQIEGQIIHHVELEETLRKLVETARTCANDTECLELLEAVEEYDALCGGTYAFQKK